MLTESRKSNGSTAVSRRKASYIYVSCEEGPVILWKMWLEGSFDAFRWKDFAWGKWRDNLETFISMLRNEEGYK